MYKLSLPFGNSSSIEEHRAAKMLVCVEQIKSFPMNWKSLLNSKCRRYLIWSAKGKLSTIRSFSDTVG